jgi:transcriptional antiterminator NusG
MTEMAEALNWYAVHVKSRHEFVAEGELAKKGLQAFLPSALKLRQWKDRKKQVRFALFPGYLFVRIAPQREQYHAVLKTKGVSSFICLEQGNPTAVPDEEMSSLVSVVGSGRDIDIYPYLKDGTKVRVRSGALKDAVGILARTDDGHQFAVNIDILGRSVGVSVLPGDIEPY